MEIAVVRYQVREQDRTTYHIEPHISTVADLRMMIQRSLNLDSDFSLGFVHHNGQALADLGLREGSVIYISDWAGDLAFALEDLEAPAEDVVVAPGDSTESGDLLGAAPADVVAPFDSTGNLSGTQLTADMTSSKKIFTEDIKWFEPSNLIGEADYAKKDTYKKIINAKIKVRVISGHAFVAGKNPEVVSGQAPVASHWVVGGDFYVDSCATLEDLRGDLRKEGRLPLPPQFSFWTLAHTRLDENLNLYANGIGDGAVILVCSQCEWRIKVTFSGVKESVEIMVDPSSTVADLKRIVSQTQLGSRISGIEQATVICVDDVLDDRCSVESQIAEGQNLEIM